MPISQWVKVEYVGGPRDGQTVVMQYPCPPELRFPRAPPIDVQSREVFTTRLSCHVYRPREGCIYDLVAVENAVTTTTEGRAFLRTACRNRKRLLYDWKGEEYV